MNHCEYSHTFEALGGPCHIRLFTENPTHGKQAAEAAEQEAKRIEQKFSRYRQDSVLSQINRLASQQEVRVDDETSALLDFAHTCYELSEGRFDITSGAYRRVWNFKGGPPPSASQIASVRSLVGWSNVVWQKPIIKFRMPNMEIDFGGFGKELAVDQAGKVLARCGIKSAMLNFGGDVLVLGPKPNHTSWTIGIRHPRKEGAVIAYVKVTSGALASSGDYERYFEHGGKRYCHIMNAQSGLPVTALQQVSVEAPSCLVAGALSTIAMLFGEKSGHQFLSSQKLRHLMVNQQGEMISYPTDLLEAIEAN